MVVSFKKKIRSLIFSVLSLFGCFNPAIAEELAIGFGEYQSAPYTIVKNHKLIGGIMFEIGNAIAKEMGLKPFFVATPRKRIDQFLDSGQIHLRCHLSPNWMSTPDNFIWSTDLYELRTVIVAKALQASQITSLDNLSGKKIGTILGYQYDETINELFETGKAFRTDAYDIADSLGMLTRSRVDVVIGTEHLISSQLKALKLENTIKTAPFVIRVQNVGCAISKNTSVKTNEIFNAIERLKANGEITRILASY